MSRDIVIVPTFRRPELLWLCLERLEAAGIQNREIWVCEDRVGDPPDWESRETAEVVAHFRTLRIEHRVRAMHSFRGNSMNVLEACRDAHEAGSRYTYLVEDDVMVTPDFFRWHEAVQVSAQPFCSVAWTYSRNRDVPMVADTGAYFTRRDMYASIGVCWSRDALAEIVKHARIEYYCNPNEYIRTHFKNDRWGNFGFEQDGLIMRVMAARGGISAWPYLSRVYHVGWWGYHQDRGRPFSGQLEERIAKTRAALLDMSQLRGRNPDIQSIPDGAIPEWSAVYCHRSL